MTQANANMNAFFLACRNRIVVGKGPLNPHLNRTSGPSDAPTDVVPPPGKDPKGKHKHNKRSHCDHQSGSGKAFGHKERSSREKKVKQQMLEFQPSTTTTLANFSTLTNQGLFVKDFQLDRLIPPTMISNHGWQVLSKSNDIANWAIFWAFLVKASALAQHL